MDVSVCMSSVLWHSLGSLKVTDILSSKYLTDRARFKVLQVRVLEIRDEDKKGRKAISAVASGAIQSSAILFVTLIALHFQVDRAALIVVQWNTSALVHKK